MNKECLSYNTEHLNVPNTTTERGSIKANSMLIYLNIPELGFGSSVLRA
jgi:hypothetical protein